MKFSNRLFLTARHWQPMAVVAGTALAPLRLGAFEAVVIFLTIGGAYLAMFRHRAARLFGNPFYAAAILYGLWAVGLALWRGQVGLADREYRYALLMSALVWFGPGLVFLRSPLRAYVIGARLAMLVCLALVLHWLVQSGLSFRSVSVAPEARLGLGNAAPFSMIAAVLALVSAIRISDAPRYLPNSPLWMTPGIVAVIASGTRSALPILVIACLWELFLAAQRLQKRARYKAYGAFLLVTALLMSVGPLQEMISDRFVSLYDQYVVRSTGEAGMNIREEMWNAAAKVIAEHPLVGVGSDKMQALSEASPQDAGTFAQFRHTHNFLIDEALNNGIIGLLLMSAYLGGMLVYVFRYNPDQHIQRNVLYFAAAVFSYGMFHNPFLHEGTIILIFGYLGFLNGQATRNRMLA